MTAQEFDEVLENLNDVEPFKAYTIEFRDGRRLEVDFPVAHRDGAAGYLGPKGAPTLFRHDEVERIIAEPASASSQ